MVVMLLLIWSLGITRTFLTAEKPENNSLFKIRFGSSNRHRLLPARKPKCLLKAPRQAELVIWTSPYVTVE